MCIACNRGLSTIARALTDRRGFLTGGLAMATYAAAPAAWADDDGRADVIFHNGPILTMEDRAPRAQALAVRGDRILAVGAAAEVRGHAGPKTRMIDLAGRALLPGFIDPHVHTVFAHFDDWLDVTPMRLATMRGQVRPTQEACYSTKARLRAWSSIQRRPPRAQ